MRGVAEHFHAAALWTESNLNRQLCLRAFIRARRISRVRWIQLGFAVLVLAAIRLITFTQASAKRASEPAKRPAEAAVDHDQVLRSLLSSDGANVVHRFRNGDVSIATADSPNPLQDHELYGMNRESLEREIDLQLTRSTAGCSSSRYFGRRVLTSTLSGVDGQKRDPGHRLCMVGPFKPRQPCYAFSFGLNRTLRFEEDFAHSSNCYALSFDPTMKQPSRMYSGRVLLLREGLATESAAHNAKTDSFMGYLKRFKANEAVIDVLKMEVWPGDWPSVGLAASDGSLRLTKQLVLNLRTEQGGSQTAEQLRAVAVALISLYSSGFRQWNLKLGSAGQLGDASVSFININFVGSNHSSRNPIGSLIDLPLRSLPISASPGFDQLSIVRQVKLSAMSPAQLDNLYFQLVEQQHLFCPDSRRIGESGDGGWDICFSRPFNIYEASHCTAFSFGINYAWQYDDTLTDKFHCRVHMFDPSMTNVKDHQRRKTSWFYRIGLSSSNKTMPNGWRMRTLCQLFNELEPGNRTIDILKIDIEYSEWAALEQALKDGCLARVKQLMFETHTGAFMQRNSNYGHFIRILLNIFDAGFKTWKWHRNPYARLRKSDSGLIRPCCYEHYMLNTNYFSPLR